MFRVLKLCWKALCFIRDLVMNMVFLGFVLLLVAIISFSSAGKKSTTLTGEGALLLNLDGYLADNRDEALRWQDALSELNGEYVSRKISRLASSYVTSLLLTSSHASSCFGTTTR